MGLFDRFNWKGRKKNLDIENSRSPLYLAISRYNEYIVRFIGLQMQGDYAPISAYEKLDGEVVGFLYIHGNDDSYSPSAEDVKERMEEKFEQMFNNHEINSYVIFYHSQIENDISQVLSNIDHEHKAITILYQFRNGPKSNLILPYKFEQKDVVFGVFAEFSKDENKIIFTTELAKGKNYFQETDEINPPKFENEYGLTIKKSNNTSVANIWKGIFGFENQESETEKNRLIVYNSLAIFKGVQTRIGNSIIYNLEYSDISFKSISLDSVPYTFYPVVKTKFSIDVENREINEWEDCGKLEAIIKANGRETFALSYFATDYAENREKYLTEKKLNVKISGIAFVLELGHIKKIKGKPNFSDDFTMYIPNMKFAHYACFDFIGQLEDFKETFLFDDPLKKGYVLKVRLITNPDFKDFFTIDMFVSPQNMKFTEFSVGMKLSGVVHFQGQIDE